MDSLTPLGWTVEFSHKWDQLAADGLRPARVVADFGTSLKVAMPHIHTAKLSGKLAHHSNRDAAPKVGDWVSVRLSQDDSATIEAIIPRKNELARKVTGVRTIKQVIAANIDIAFVIIALDNDFSVERLSRYLYQLSANHIHPIIVLNKADKTDKLDDYTEQLEHLNIPILITSAVEGRGVDQIINRISPGATAVLLGSSGVGKSTLTNQLLGTDTQRTQAVRASDSTGKHTTVHRELFILPSGGLLIDMPGIRELQLWGSEVNLDENFDDIAALIQQCHYPNCQHQSEDRCAIREALHAGSLDPSHWKNYQKMKLELTNLRGKTQTRTRIDNKKSHKNIKKRSAVERRETRDEINGR